MPSVRSGSFPLTLATRFTLVLPDAPPPPDGHPLVVALHGARDDGARLRERLPGLESIGAAVLSPDGPYPVEIRGEPGKSNGRVGFTWYQFTGDQAAFIASMEVTGAHLERLIDHVAAEHPIDRARIVLLGYSQGGYLAGYHALVHRERYRGLIAIACRIKVEALGPALERARGFPVLVVHGKNDEFVKWDGQQTAVETLRAAGAAVQVHLHDGGHGLRPEQSTIITDFVRATV